MRSTPMTSTSFVRPRTFSLPACSIHPLLAARCMMRAALIPRILKRWTQWRPERGERSRMTDLYPSRCAAEPEMLPRQDPVLHGDWVPNAPLSAEQAAHFDREGYLVLENIFSTEEVAALQAETARLLASSSEERRVGKGCVSTCRSRWS